MSTNITRARATGQPFHCLAGGVLDAITANA